MKETNERANRGRCKANSKRLHSQCFVSTKWAVLSAHLTARADKHCWGRDAGCFFKPSLTPTFPLITPLPLPPSLPLSRLLTLCLSPPLSPRSVSLWAQTLPCLTPIGWAATNLASGRAGGTAYAKPCFILMSCNCGFKSLIRRVQELLVPTGCAYRLSPGERSC